MTTALNTNSAPCRFKGEHPTVSRPASRLPLSKSIRVRAGALCPSTRRGLRASSRPRLRDSRARRPASRVAPRRAS